MIQKTKADYLKEHKSWGNIKIINIPEKDARLAELVGILLGDGNIYFCSKSKRICSYSVRIAGDFEKDRDYHLNYIAPLCNDLFKINVRIRNHTVNNERFVCLESRLLIDFLISIGLKAGDKIKNKVGIPNWIFENTEFLKACLRGLIDTDGSVYRMSKRDKNLIRMDFTNYNRTLLDDTRAAFIRLGFNPSKIICNNKFFISRQDDIARYIREIGFSNNKHIERLKLFSPVV